MTGDVPSAQLAQDEQDPTAAASGAELDDAPLPGIGIHGVTLLAGGRQNGFHVLRRARRA